MSALGPNFGLGLGLGPGHDNKGLLKVFGEASVNWITVYAQSQGFGFGVRGKGTKA